MHQFQGILSIFTKVRMGTDTRAADRQTSGSHKHLSSVLGIVKK